MRVITILTDAAACGFVALYTVVNTVTISNKCYSATASQPASQSAGRQFQVTPASSWLDDFAGRRDTHSYLTRTKPSTCTHYGWRRSYISRRSQRALMENIFFLTRGFNALYRWAYYALISYYPSLLRACVRAGHIAPCRCHFVPSHFAAKSITDRWYEL